MSNTARSIVKYVIGQIHGTIYKGAGQNLSCSRAIQGMPLSFSFETYFLVSFKREIKEIRWCRHLSEWKWRIIWGCATWHSQLIVAPPGYFPSTANLCSLFVWSPAPLCRLRAWVDADNPNAICYNACFQSSGICMINTLLTRHETYLRLPDRWKRTKLEMLFKICSCKCSTA